MSSHLRMAALTAAAGIIVAVIAAAGHVRAAADDSTSAFHRAASVLHSPRCANCHTLTDFPRQGDDRHPHLFNVRRGGEDRGATAFACTTCHGRANNVSSGVLGAEEDWRLPPLSMGWEGLSEAELCRHLKDPARNGGRTGAAVIEHLHTSLVKWAWMPGKDIHGRDRSLPPLSYEDFVKAMESWVTSGAQCP